MNIIKKEYKVFKFDELSDTAKDKAIEKLWDINVSFEWWEGVYSDAENIGLKITAFDIDRGNTIEAKVITSPRSIAEKILSDHGKDCDTFKIAQKYCIELNEYEKVITDDTEYTIGKEIDDLNDEFIRAIKEEYLSMLKKEYEYQTSREQIIESIKCNEYDFSEEGNFPAY